MRVKEGQPERRGECMMGAQRDGRLPGGHKVQVPGTPSDVPRPWHTLDRPRDLTSFRCLALEEVVMDADPGANSKATQLLTNQMWANLGGRRVAAAAAECGLGRREGGDCSKSTAGFTLI
jgi:hypothetical protein